MLNQPAVKNRNLAMKINAVMRSFTVKMLAAVDWNISLENTNE